MPPAGGDSKQHVAPFLTALVAGGDQASLDSKTESF